MRYLIFILLLSIPIIAFAFTDAAIIKLINERILEHSAETKWIMGIVSGGLAIAAGWIFKLISDNKARLNEMDLMLHSDFKEVRATMDRNCTKVTNELSAHKLYVANNYTKDSKIEQLVKHEIDPLKEQLTLLQSTINILVASVADSKRDRS